MPTNLTAFAHALRSLLLLADDVHAASNRGQELAFADERGWLKDGESDELAAVETRVRAGLAEIDARIASIVTTHSDAWTRYVQTGLDVFAALPSRYADTPVPGRSVEDGRFDSLLCASLDTAWTAMLRGCDTTYSLAWALSVGESVRRRYEPYLT